MVTDLEFKFRILQWVTRSVPHGFHEERVSLQVLTRMYSEDFSGGRWVSYRCGGINKDGTSFRDLWLNECELEEIEEKA